MNKALWTETIGIGIIVTGVLAGFYGQALAMNIRDHTMGFTSPLFGSAMVMLGTLLYLGGNLLGRARDRRQLRRAKALLPQASRHHEAMPPPADSELVGAA